MFYPLLTILCPQFPVFLGISKELVVHAFLRESNSSNLSKSHHNPCNRCNPMDLKHHLSLNFKNNLNNNCNHSLSSMSSLFPSNRYNHNHSFIRSKNYSISLILNCSNLSNRLQKEPHLL